MVVAEDISEPRPDWQELRKTPIGKRWVGQSEPIDRGEFETLLDLIYADPYGVEMSDLRGILDNRHREPAQKRIIQAAFAIVLADLKEREEQGLGGDGAAVAAVGPYRGQTTTSRLRSEFRATTPLDPKEFEVVQQIIAANFNVVTTEDLWRALDDNHVKAAKERIFRVAYCLIAGDRERGVEEPDQEIRRYSSPLEQEESAALGAKKRRSRPTRIFPPNQLNLLRVRVSNLGGFRDQGDLSKQLREKYTAYRNLPVALLNSSLTAIMPELLGDAYREIKSLRSKITIPTMPSPVREVKPGPSAEDVVAAREEIGTLNRGVERLEGLARRLRLQGLSIEQAVREAASKKGDAEEIATLKGRIQTLEDEARAKSAGYSRMAAENTGLKDENRELRQRIKRVEALEAQIAELESSLSAERKVKEDLQAEVDRLKPFETEAQRLAAENEALKAELAEARAENTGLRDKAERRERQQGPKDARLEKLESRFQREEAQNKEEARQAYAAELLDPVLQVLGRKEEFEKRMGGLGSGKRLAVLSTLFKVIEQVKKVLETPIEQPKNTKKKK